MGFKQVVFHGRGGSHTGLFSYSVTEKRIRFRIDMSLLEGSPLGKGDKMGLYYDPDKECFALQGSENSHARSLGLATGSEKSFYVSFSRQGVLKEHFTEFHGMRSCELRASEPRKGAIIFSSPLRSAEGAED